MIRLKNISISTNIKLTIVKDGSNILNTGGGIFNLTNNSLQNDFFVFNPDTIWNENYLSEIKNMESFYFQK